LTGSDSTPDPRELELYKLAVEMADRILDSAFTTSNSFFLGGRWSRTACTIAGVEQPTQVLICAALIAELGLDRERRRGASDGG
jgi:hypothetical protein